MLLSCDHRENRQAGRHTPPRCYRDRSRGCGPYGTGRVALHRPSPPRRPHHPRHPRHHLHPCRCPCRRRHQHRHPVRRWGHLSSERLGRRSWPRSIRAPLAQLLSGRTWLGSGATTAVVAASRRRGEQKLQRALVEVSRRRRNRQRGSMG